MKTQFSLLILTLFTSLSCLAAETYQVSTSVFTQGKLIAAPVMVVEAEKTASVSMGGDFQYQLTLTPNANDSANISTLVTVGNSTIKPSFQVKYGERATVEIGSQKVTLLVSKVGT